jgi:hypothetical protein
MKVFQELVVKVNLKDLSIIIPLGSEEGNWSGLLEDLTAAIRVLIGDAQKERPEVLWVGTTEEPSEDRQVLLSDVVDALPFDARWVSSLEGRAQQLNRGAREARGEFLWFLHADTRLEKKTLQNLLYSLAEDPTALHYFNLRFLSDGPKAMGLTSAGVWFRSHFFKVPFGDQGFCISRELFFKLKGFPEEAPFGEDHLFVWTARRSGVGLHCVGSSIATSARKYHQLGWVRLTSRHFYLTWKQAIPQAWIMVKEQTQDRFKKRKTLKEEV